MVEWRLVVVLLGGGGRVGGVGRSRELPARLADDQGHFLNHGRHVAVVLPFLGHLYYNLNMALLSSEFMMRKPFAPLIRTVAEPLRPVAYVTPSTPIAAIEPARRTKRLKIPPTPPFEWPNLSQVELFINPAYKYINPGDVRRAMKVAGFYTGANNGVREVMKSLGWHVVKGSPSLLRPDIGDGLTDEEKQEAAIRLRVELRGA